MKLSDRIAKLSHVFDLLQSTTSLNEKRSIIDRYIDADLQDDFNFCIEVLNGVHKLGYTYYKAPTINTLYVNEEATIKDIYTYLQMPLKYGDLSMANINSYVARTVAYADFLEPLVNRKLRLGIGNSILPKNGLSAMLAKKFEDREASLYARRTAYYVTEKLDGNRCIAHYDGLKWNFTSRNNKPMKVNFDMSGLPTDRVYDGEILSPAQVKLSKNIHTAVRDATIIKPDTDAMFNATSGLINSDADNKDLVYNIFDVMEEDVRYIERRLFLDKLKFESNNVRILPTLAYGNNAMLTNIKGLLEIVVASGGEGIMLNTIDGLYTHKRTDELIKYKPVYTMDMEVTGILPGTGKYEGMVGALEAEAITDEGNIIFCNIGTGLSDEQRLRWSLHPEEIHGHIIEVSYFSVSQNSRTADTRYYSLRFPRLKKVRDDKVSTSQY